MERYDKFYKDFKRPNYAPIYTPTAEEFIDPIAYVAKIKPEAEKYGVVKIIPPDNFKPPFVIDGARFEFTPRVQKLNEIEASVRERVVFLDKLLHYWKLQGVPVVCPRLDNKYLDLFRLHQLVFSMGGPEEVTRLKQWQTIAKKINIRTTHGGSKVKEHYYKLVYPYISKLEETSVKKEENYSSDEEFEIKDCASGCTSDSMQGGKRRKGRMMAGLPKSKHQLKKKKLLDPMENVFCSKCNGGDQEALLLLCEMCDKSTHTFCCDPPLSSVPKEEWHCADCSAAEVLNMECNYGFYDANTKYNLISFSDFANKFKRDYFKKDLKDISDEDVEKEFWKNIMNTEQTVSVKYGADLRVDKVGSGFPRKTDDLRGVDLRMKQHYANHAWNLNNLPVLKDSVLSHIDSDISGMMVPWVYVGMCFSTFCWHTEDHWTYSINYNHKGERKIWYGIGGPDADKFEDAVRSISPGLFRSQRDLLHHMTIAVNPQVLLSKGVNVTTVHQNAGEFVITFPRAYHAGYNEGFNVAEAVNFAPIDWLKMGRLAVNDYAGVRRTCVFSHEELVLKMVTACDKLSIAMSVAAYEELQQMFQREVKRRQIVASLGVRKHKREIFEDFPDEQRECKHCNTTVFLSALTCTHDKTVCLDHSHKLCSKCPYKECTMRYRYEMPELVPFLTKLKDRTTAYSDWKEKVANVLDDIEHKPMLHAIDSLLEIARSRRFPNGRALGRLHSIQRTCQAALEKANHLLNGKIKTRTKTRIQRADSRPSLADIDVFLLQLDDLPCDVSDTKKKIVDLKIRISDWSERAKAVCERLENEDTDSLDELREMLEQGETFDVKMEELETVDRCVRLCEWRRRALRLLHWAPFEGMQSADDFLSKGRWSIDAVLAMVDEGKRVCGSKVEDPESTVRLLHSKMKTGIMHNNESDQWFSDGCPGGEVALESLWNRVKVSDWLSDKGMAMLREELVRCQDMKDRLEGKEVSLRDAEELVEECAQSVVIRDSISFENIRHTRDKLTTFTKRMAALFHKPNSYYSLYNMICGRDDLTALAEGQSCPLYLQGDKEPVEEWDEIDSFDTLADMSSHCAQLSDKQIQLMRALRIVNEKRPLRESCVCAQDKERDAVLILCLLCNGRFHATCVDWDPFLGHLPPGCFLCIRCLRSRRPGLEDVQMAANQAPSNSFEVQLVKDAISRIRESRRAAMEVIVDLSLCGNELNTELSDRLERVLIQVISSEIVDFDLLPKICPIISKVYADKLQMHTAAWELIRSRPARSKPMNPLFVSQMKRKRNVRRTERSRARSCIGVAGKRRRQKAVYHDEEEPCSAERCLKPCSEQLNWIQCEAGCSRWYHYVCVGLTRMKAANLGAYSCYKCKSTND